MTQSLNSRYHTKNVEKILSSLLTEQNHRLGEEIQRTTSLGMKQMWLKVLNSGPYTLTGTITRLKRKLDYSMVVILCVSSMQRVVAIWPSTKILLILAKAATWKLLYGFTKALIPAMNSQQTKCLKLKSHKTIWNVVAHPWNGKRILFQESKLSLLNSDISTLVDYYR